MKMTYRFPSSSRQQQGFGLTECILSVGISATSLLAVIGMLMGTLRVAQDAKEETTSGVLLRQLAGEFKDIQKPADPEAAMQPLVVLLDSSMRILEHSKAADGAGVLDTYESGSADLNASSFARIDRVISPAGQKMDQIVIRVETPASAPAAGRNVRLYAALAPK